MFQRQLINYSLIFRFNAVKLNFFKNHNFKNKGNRANFNFNKLTCLKWMEGLFGHSQITIKELIRFIIPTCIRIHRFHSQYDNSNMLISMN